MSFYVVIPFISMNAKIKPCIVFIFIIFLISEKVFCNDIDSNNSIMNNNMNTNNKDLYGGTNSSDDVNQSNVFKPERKEEVFLENALDSEIGNNFLERLLREILKNYKNPYQATNFQDNRNETTLEDNPLFLMPDNETDNDSEVFNLDDILLHHKLRDVIFNSNDSQFLLKSDNQYSSKQTKYPPWHMLSKEQKLDIIRQSQGDPQIYNDWITISVNTFYGLLLVVGIPGNGLSILIILTNSYMRTSPNIFLLNIALADFVTLTMGKYFSFK